MPKALVSLTLLTLLLPPSGSSALQQAGATLDTQRLLAEADSLLKIGNADSAGSLYSSVASVEPANLRALIGLGKSALGVRDWDRAVDAADKISGIDPASLAGHYIEAVARREKGSIAFREPGYFGPSIVGDWGRARRLFTWVVTRDSGFEDILCQFALLNRYEGNKQGALDLISREAALRPELIEPQVGRYRLYQYFIATEDSAHVVDWLRTLPGDLPRYFVGELWRRHGNVAGADSVFNMLLARAGEVSPQALRLSLARLMMKQGRGEEAEKEYWKGIHSANTRLGLALLLEDVKYIISDQELYLFRSIDSVSGQRQFFRSFWNFRNPSLALKTNQRLQDHVRRFVYAEEHFEYYGARTRFNNPDRQKELRFPAAFALNERFNDKGLIYIRQGDPDDVIRHSYAPFDDENSKGEGFVAPLPRHIVTNYGAPTPDEQMHAIEKAQRDYDAHWLLSYAHDEFESWLYDATPESPRMVFHFQMHNAVRNNWRLVPIPALDAMLDELGVWDSKYTRMYDGMEVERSVLQAQISNDSRDIVRYALSTERQTWAKATEVFHFPHAIDVFRAPRGQCLVDVSYAIPLAALSRSVPDTVKSIPVEVGFSLVDAKSLHAASQLDTIQVSLSRSRTGMLLDLVRYTVPPDSYAVSMHLRPLVGDKIATWREKLRASDFSRPGLRVSSIQLLRPSPEKGALDIDGVKVVQSPLSTHVRTEKLLVYFQMYHLVADVDGVTSYRTECTLQPFDDPDPAKGILVYSKDKTGSEEMAAQFCQIDVHYVPAGHYRLIVKATDRKRVESCVAERELHLVKP
ncbi:MAG TPA: GWxTD domain-containing protein [Bacteroidota bacterium]|nr:GWxTD domain-containing protein [Bacteroidota bacterium]